MKIYIDLHPKCNQIFSSITLSPNYRNLHSAQSWSQLTIRDSTRLCSGGLVLLSFSPELDRWVILPGGAWLIQGADREVILSLQTCFTINKTISWARYLPVSTCIVIPVHLTPQAFTAPGSPNYSQPFFLKFDNLLDSDKFTGHFVYLNAIWQIHQNIHVHCQSHAPSSPHFPLY